MRTKEEIAAAQKAWREAHPDRVAAYRKKAKPKEQAKYAARREAISVRSREWQRANPGKVKGYRRKTLLKNRYSMTVEQYDQMFASQFGRCAICHKSQDDEKLPLAVDHCHKTGKIRGLLCASCNKGLGHFRDRGDILGKAIEYLVRSSK